MGIPRTDWSGLAGAISLVFVLCCIIIIRCPRPDSRRRGRCPRQFRPSKSDNGLHEAGLATSLFYPSEALPIEEEQTARPEGHNPVVDYVGVHRSVTKLLERLVGRPGGQDPEQRLGLGLGLSVHALVRLLSEVAHQRAPSVPRDGRGSPGKAEILTRPAHQAEIQRELYVERVLVVEPEERRGQGNEVDGLDEVKELRGMLLDVRDGIGLHQAAEGMPDEADLCEPVQPGPPWRRCMVVAWHVLMRLFAGLYLHARLESVGDGLRGCLGGGQARLVGVGH